MSWWNLEGNLHVNENHINGSDSDAVPNGRSFAGLASAVGDTLFAGQDRSGLAGGIVGRVDRYAHLFQGQGKPALGWSQMTPVCCQRSDSRGHRWRSEVRSSATSYWRLSRCLEYRRIRLNVPAAETKLLCDGPIRTLTASRVRCADMWRSNNAS